MGGGFGSMEYSSFQGMAMDVPPLMEERSSHCSSSSTVGSCQQQHQLGGFNPYFPGISWSTTDPTTLVAEYGGVQQPVFSKFEFKGHGGAPGSMSGVDQHGCGSSYDSSFGNNCSNALSLVPMDVTSSNVSGSNSNPFSFGGPGCVPGGDGSGSGATAHSTQWMQMCSLLSDQCYNDALPQLISDSMVAGQQQHCMYSPSSDYLHEADSSGSSADRDMRPSLSRSCLQMPGSSFSGDNNNWRNSDVLQANLGVGGLLSGTLELPDESSLVAADGEFTDPGNSHSLSLVRKHRSSLPMDCLPVSWMSQSTQMESESSAMVTSGTTNHHGTALDPLLGSVMNANDCGGLSSSPLSFKRQRAFYTLDNIPTKPLTQQLAQLTSLSRSISPRSCRSNFPIGGNSSSGRTDSLFKDLHFTSRQLPSGPPKQSVVVHDLVGSTFGSSRGAVFDHDTLLMPNRKHNATSIEPQSVAARQRRKRISERVRIVSKLIPGGNKMDTASMLDEAIDYVKFLQLQVQILESLGEVPEGDIFSTNSAFPANEPLDSGKDRFAQRIGCFETHLSKACSNLQQARPSACPLILSEVLQQQLFKQKLCLVSLRQCPTTIQARPCSTSGP